jgi:ubiquinone/menaquinone biosynthesis C-methylase UbiE
VAEELSSKYHREKAKVLDMCCGVGFSTRALVQAFPDAEKIIGVDTSPQMLAMARFISAHVVHLKPWWIRMAKSFNKLRAVNCKLQDYTDVIRGSQFAFEKGNAESTPFQDGAFDVVTIM